MMLNFYLAINRLRVVQCIEHVSMVINLSIVQKLKQVLDAFCGLGTDALGNPSRETDPQEEERILSPKLCLDWRLS